MTPLTDAELDDLLDPLIAALGSGRELANATAHRLALACRRLREERDAAERRAKVADLKASGTLANNLCPDHRDKQTGRPCLACLVERTERERDAARDALRDERDALRAACEAALPIVNDRAMGRRMIRPDSEAAEVERQLRAALAKGVN